jgi:glycosyltransferase involved in cell wall biosynthesis
MKITMLLFGFFPSDVRVRKEAVTLMESGHQLKVLCCAEKDGLTNFGSIKIPKVGVPSEWGGKMTSIQLIKFWIYSFRYLLLYRDFDVLHCHDLTGLPPAVCYKIFFPKTKIIYDSHEIYPDQVMEKIGKLVGFSFLMLEKFCIKFANRTIGISKPQEELMRNRYNIEDFLYLPNYPTKIEFFREEKPPNEKITIVYSGAILPDRGYEQLVKAIAILHRKRDDFIVKLIGDGPLRRTIEKEVEVRGLTSCIEIIGSVHYSEVRDYLNSADIGIALYHPTPVTNYGLSNKVFEYIRCELPVIFPYRRANAYYLKKIGGINVNPYSSKDIAEKIEFLITHPEIRETMRKAEKDLASKCVWESIEKHLVELYSNI